MGRHISDELLQNGVRCYVSQIAEDCRIDGAEDIAVMVIMARPRGDGHYKVIAGGAVNGQSIQHSTATDLLKAALYAHEKADGATGLIVPGRLLVPPS